MPVELPKEVWTEILKRMTSMFDWGRLQQVSQTFNAIIRDDCWVQVKTLKYWSGDEYEYDGKSTFFALELNDQKQFKVMQTDKLLLLVEELGKKATKIQSVSLKTDELDCPEDPFLILQYLTSASLKVEELCIRSDYFSNRGMASLAEFVCSISGTLKSLEFQINYSVISPELFPAFFRQCIGLESVQLVMAFVDHVEATALVESVLFGASKLKTLKLRLPYYSTMDDATLTALLNTDAHLSNCDLNRSFLEAYVKKVQMQNLVATYHPLKSLKTLTVEDDYLMMLPPLELFPDLEQLKMMSEPLWATPAQAKALVSQFLSQYKDVCGEPRVLLLEVKDGRGWPSLEQMVEEMDWPVSAMEEETDLTMELSFIRGNATAKLLIRRDQGDQYPETGNYSDYSGYSD